MHWTRTLTAATAAAFSVATVTACDDLANDVTPPTAPARSVSRSIGRTTVSGAPLSYVVEEHNTSTIYRPITIADMDGDGRPEIVIGTWNPNTIEIWKYDPALGAAVRWQQITGSIPGNIHGITTADVDEDGDRDIILAVRFAGIYLCRNDGGGAAWSVTGLHGTYAWNVQVADFDGDGHGDIFGALDDGAVLLYGDGHGAFTPGPVPWMFKPFSVSVADFNDDGRPDLIGPDFTRLVAHVNPGGRASWPEDTANSGPYAYQLVSELTPTAVDLDHDGYVDQVALLHASDGYGPPMSVGFFRGGRLPNGALTWSPLTVIDVLSQRSLPIGAADLDDDGHLDIFVGGSLGFPGLVVYRGDGAGHFGARESVSSPSGYGFGMRNSISVVDFDGDGTSDIVATQHVVGQHPDYVPGGFAILYRRVVNRAPSAALAGGASRTVTEGEDVVFSLGASDPDGDALTYTADYGDGTSVGPLPLPSSPLALHHTYADNATAPFTVTVSVSDGALSATTTQDVTVQNAAPSVGAVAVPLDPVQVGSPVTATAGFTDPGTMDTHTGAAAWDVDLPFAAASVSETGGAGTVSATSTALAAGVYTITLRVTDKDAATTQRTASTYVVVYDPSGNFVTGGGWFTSPAAACDPSLCGYDGPGKATFGFVAKYVSGATKPSGNTEFAFHAGELRFVSTSYDWLVVGGPRAQYKGTGTVNGIGGYQFLVTAIDGAVSGGGGVDKFRVKIWSAGGVVYDNQRGARDDSNDATALGGGSIVIHK